MYNNKLLDGTSQHVSIYTNKCYGEDVPFGTTDVTNIEITNNKHDVNMIKSNFLNVTARATINLNTDCIKTVDYNDVTTINDIIKDESAVTQTETDSTYHTFYIGWKNASECITQMQVFNKGNDTGYIQIFQDRENYLESMKYTTKTKKDMNRDCHLIYENIIFNEDCSMPGIILTSEDYLKNIAEETYVSYKLQYPIKNHKVVFLDDPIAGEFGKTKNTEVDLDENNYKKLMFLLANGTYALFKDVVFKGFDLKEVNESDGTTKYQTSAPDGSAVQEFDSKNDVLNDCVNNYPNRIPVCNSNPDYPKEYKFITQRKYGILQGKDYTVDIPLIIPLNTISAFRSMDLFEKVFGDITCRLMFGPRSMVWNCDKNKLIQINDTDLTTNVSLSVTDFRITQLTCDCYGYNVDPIELQAVQSKLTDRQRIYEVRYTDFKNYDGNMINGHFHIEFPYPLTMVKDIHMTFPRKNYQTTVFRNPLLKNAQLKIDGILYPRNLALDTSSKRFYHMQIENFDADDDLKYSYTCPQVKSDGTIMDDDDKIEYLDDTNFLITWNLANGPFFGVNTGNDNVNIIFTADRIHKIAKLYGCTNTGDSNDDEPNPQIWFTRDAWWSLDTKFGLVFCNKVAPAHELYQSDADIRFIQ